MDEERVANEWLTKDELSELLAPADQPAVPARSGAEARSTRVQTEFVVQYWENAVRELQREVRELRERVAALEGKQSAVRSAAPSVPAQPVAVEPPVKTAESKANAEPPLSRRDRHKSSRWF